ncbi:MAG TPA: transcriptional regulator [Lactobacillus sp.]|nr:transcriptional regulator [Lactobacillus sp.]
MNIEQITTDKRLAEIFKVLSEPHRISILRILHENRREMTCGEVGEQLNLAKSTVSYHFKALRQAGLTNTRQVSQTKLLSINETTFEQYLPHFFDVL